MNVQICEYVKTRYIRIYIHIFVSLFIYSYIPHINMNKYTSENLYIRVHAIHTRACTHVSIHTYACTHVSIHTYTHVRMCLLPITNKDIRSIVCTTCLYYLSLLPVFTTCLCYLSLTDHKQGHTQHQKSVLRLLYYTEFHLARKILRGHLCVCVCVYV